MQCIVILSDNYLNWNGVKDFNLLYIMPEKHHFQGKRFSLERQFNVQKSAEKNGEKVELVKKGHRMRFRKNG